MRAIAPATDRRWVDLFAMPLWSEPSGALDADLPALAECLYDLGLVVPFDWPGWNAPDRFPGGDGLESAPAANAVRLLTSYVRGARFCDGALLGGVADGSIPAAVVRLWDWHRSCVAPESEFVDRAQYSADDKYRWLYERRWAPGGVMCWVGLNPGTGDRDAGPPSDVGPRRVVGEAGGVRRGGRRQSVLVPVDGPGRTSFSRA